MSFSWKHSEPFERRHDGPDANDIRTMLRAIGAPTLDALVEQTLPASIRLGRQLDLPAAVDEAKLLEEMEALAARNQVFKSFIGAGYSDTVVPPVILRNIFQNPGWYTQYTPYQPEISQGRLEALLNFQTMVIDLTGLPVANASLLDEGTAAAEAMHMFAAQALLAIMAGMYAAWHGPAGLKAIAERVHALTVLLARGLQKLGVKVRHQSFFDTLRLDLEPAAADRAIARALQRRMNLRRIDNRSIGISLDETTRPEDVQALLAVFAGDRPVDFTLESLGQVTPAWPAALVRKSHYLTHPVFHRHHSETEMLRYVKRLEAKDLSLTYAMIPLGSCTMKLNATAEMIPVTFPGFSRLHPFAPVEQAQGYQQLFHELEGMLAEITGFSAVSLQPNAGSQGEYAGLLVIRKWHESRGDKDRRVCLIPASAHGTNPASAVMAGFEVVVVKSDEDGSIDLADLEAKATEHGPRLGALMVTYPSTHGVFEEEIRRICDIVHAHGGQVYLDGANMNAQVGLCRPGDFGADVCHLNLHKTFCIPHGGGGPGMGPICVASHLAPFLPGHPLVKTGGAHASGPVSAAPWGSSSILVISYAYIRMMGPDGLKRATEQAILSANYVAARLAEHFPVLYRGARARVAHECILDLRGVKKSAGIEVDDVAKRLIDYGFHAPTVSFPVAGTVMVEPTESESLAELDRFCEAMISIRKEIAEVEVGRAPREGNVLKHAPHTAEVVTAAEWNRPYPRQLGAFPSAFVRAAKFWPAVGRLNNVLGDRKLMCSCPPTEDYA